MKQTSLFTGTLLACVFIALQGLAQMPVAPPAPAVQDYSAGDLDQMLGPIALYPDPLIAIILPAATLPTQIVLADRYIADGGDPNLVDEQPWDASVQALARYPDVLKYLDDNLAWTTALGQAFLNQPQDVMDSIQRLRASAQNNGNLQSTPQQQVVDDGGDIEIVPADPDVIYVPVYAPDQIYYQGGCALTFGAGCAAGVWLNGDFDWQHHRLINWDQNHPRPADWWHRSPQQRDTVMARQTTVWRPQDHRDVNAPRQGDRGYAQPVARANTPGRPAPRPTTAYQAPTHDNQPRENQPHDNQPHTVPVVNTPRPAPVVSRPEPVERATPVSRPASNGAFIGVQSSQATRSFSDRGQQSMQTVTHSAPAPAPAPVSRPSPAPSGGGGGGGGGASHGGGSQPKH